MSIELKNELITLEQKRKEAADQILMLEKQIEEAKSSAVKKPQYIVENESKSAFELIFNCPDIESLNYILTHVNCEGFNLNMLLVQIINRKDKLFLMDALVTLDKRGLISKSDMFLATENVGSYVDQGNYFGILRVLFEDIENEFSMYLAAVLILYRRNVNVDDDICMPMWLKNAFKSKMTHLDNYFMNYALGLYSIYETLLPSMGRDESRLEKTRRAVSLQYADGLANLITPVACYGKEISADAFNFFIAMNSHTNTCFGWQSNGSVRQSAARYNFSKIMYNLIQSNKFEEARSFAARYEEESVKFYIFPLSRCPNIDVAVYKKWRAILPEDYFKFFDFMSHITTVPIYSAELFREIIKDFNFDRADMIKSDTAKMRAISECIANKCAHYVPILLEKFAQL